MYCCNITQISPTLVKPGVIQISVTATVNRSSRSSYRTLGDTNGFGARLQSLQSYVTTILHPKVSKPDFFESISYRYSVPTF